jgi:hypothetical protein
MVKAGASMQNQRRRHRHLHRHRRLRLLVAGATPFDELGALWNDHFINLREYRLGFFD